MGRSGRHQPPPQQRRRPASRRRGYAAIGAGLAVIGGGLAAVSLVPHRWLNGWRLVAALPGDQVTSASGAAYQTDGGTATFDQALLQSGIAPGSSLTLTFDAQGTTTRPSGCSLSGSACAA